MQALRRLARRALRTLRGSPVRLVYHVGYESPFRGLPMDRRRARRIVAFLAHEGLLGLNDLYRPRPASLEALLRIHDPAYIESLDDVEAVTRALGTPVNDAQRQAAVDLQRLHAGGTLLAVRMALRTGKTVVNAGGGFHHATPDRGMGFCLVNDIAVAIASARHHGFTGRVLVVDLDLHDGNGTRAAFARDATVHTLSIHNDDWEPAGGIATSSVALGANVADEPYLAAIRGVLPELVAAVAPGLVVYVAGCDPAADDRLGNWRISAGGMLARDRLVMETLRARGDPPVAVVLAGGYGREAWRYTARFVSWLATGHAVEPPGELDLVLERFRGAGDVLHEEPAGDDDGWGLTPEDLGAVAPVPARDGRVLGAFSRHAVELSLERVGVLDALRDRGFAAPTVAVDTASGVGDTILVYADPDREGLLVELRVSRSRRIVPDMEVLYVEWLRLQNPRAAFDARHPRLPGQEHPGLGLLHEIVGWLVVVCERLGLDGLAFTASEFYMAVLARHHARFLDPAAQGHFDAIRRAVDHLPLPEAVRALREGRVRDGSGQRVAWEPAVQVYPVSSRMRRALSALDQSEQHRNHYELQEQPGDEG